MNIETELKIYSLLSIGARGAGKTVFLSSCYQALQDRALSLKCDDEESEENIDKILQYIARTGQYPPATLQLGNFDFLIEQQGEKLGIFRWWDVPGESCHLYNLAFLNMLLNAEGCLLFLDATRLLSEDRESRTSLEIFQTIVEIVNHNKHRFILGVVVTKCDLLMNDSEKWNRLETHIEKLDKILKNIGIDYQVFYSQVVIDPDTLTLRSDRAESVMRWLFSRMIGEPIPILCLESTNEKDLPPSENLVLLTESNA